MQQRKLWSSSHRTWWGAALVAVVAAAGCRKDEAKPAAPAPESTQKAASATQPAPAKPKPVAKKLEWDDPSEWKRVKPSSSMRHATYQVPPAKGDKQGAELNVFILRGEVDDNVRRWVDEFKGFDPKTLVRNDRTTNDLPQTIVEIPKGTFSGGMASKTASENYGLLGAIVSMPAGHKYFFKLTGPSATVKAAREPFYRLLDSARLEGGAATPPGSSKATTAPASTGTAPAAADGKPASPPNQPSSATKH